jgi:hypothetical protein
MTASVIAAQNASIRASSSGSGLEVEINAQLATLLSHTIMNVQISASKNPATQGHLQAVVTYQDGAAAISTPYVLKLFTGKTLADAGAQANAYMAARPSYFFSPMSFSVPEEQRSAAPCVLGLLYNTSYVDGLSHFGVGGTGGGGGGTNPFINVDDYATGDGVTDDAAAINTAIALAITQKKGVVFGNKTYLVLSSIHLPPGTVFADNMRMNFIFNGSAIVGSAAGTYTQIKTGQGTNTGLYVIFDYAWTLWATFLGTFSITGVNGHNHVGFASSVQDSGSIGLLTNLTVNTCQYGIYGADSTVPVGGSLTGWNFLSVTCEQCDTGIWFSTNQDDINFGVIRCNSSYGTQDQIQFLGAGNVIVGSLFLHGNTGIPGSKNGLIYGTTGLVITHCFVEGAHLLCIGTGANLSGLTILNLRVSGGEFACTYDAPIFVGNALGQVNVTVDPSNTSNAVTNGFIDAIVAVYNQANSSRNIKVRAPWTYTFCAPYKIAGGLTSNDDTVSFEGDGAQGNWVIQYRNSTLYPRRYVQDISQSRTYDAAGVAKFSTPQLAGRTISVVNGDKIAVDDPDTPGTLIKLEAAAPGATVGLFTGYSYSTGKVIILYAGTNNVSVSINGEIGGFGPGVTAYLGPDGADARTLVAGGVNYLVLAWDDGAQLWKMLSFTEPSAVSSPSVSNGAAIILYDRATAPSLVQVNSDNDANVIYTYGTYPEWIGKIVTVYASGGSDFTLNDTLTGTQTVEFMDGLSTHTYYANRYNSSTFICGASRWIEIARGGLDGSQLSLLGSTAGYVQGVGGLSSGYATRAYGLWAKADHVFEDAHGIAEFDYGASDQGQGQLSRMGWYGYTTDATVTEISQDGINYPTAGAAPMTVPIKSLWFMEIRAQVQGIATDDWATWEITVKVRRTAGGTLAVVGTPTGTGAPGESSGGAFATINLDITADDTNKRVACTVTGIAATGIRWLVYAEVLISKYA